MAQTTSVKFAGTGANHNDGGNTAWSNPTNIEGDATSTAATCAPGTNDHTSQRLRASNFGFEIPTGATIVGVLAEMEVQSSNNSRWQETSIQLLVSGAESGNDKGGTSTWTTTKGFREWGGASDLWGLSLTPTIVNNSGFGLSHKGTRKINTVTASVFRVRITVYYTEGYSKKIMNVTNYAKVFGVVKANVKKVNGI